MLVCVCSTSTKQRYYFLCCCFKWNDKKATRAFLNISANCLLTQIMYTVYNQFFTVPWVLNSQLYFEWFLIFLPLFHGHPNAWNLVFFDLFHSTTLFRHLFHDPIFSPPFHGLFLCGPFLSCYEPLRNLSEVHHSLDSRPVPMYYRNFHNLPTWWGIGPKTNTHKQFDNEMRRKNTEIQFQFLWQFIFFSWKSAICYKNIENAIK